MTSCLHSRLDTIYKNGLAGGGTETRTTITISLKLCCSIINLNDTNLFPTSNILDLKDNKECAHHAGTILSCYGSNGGVYN